MDERDVLTTDIRVTAIGDSGQYIFDWVDQESGKVEFLEEQSDYDSYNSEVERALNANGVFIEDSDSSESTEQEQRSTSPQNTDESQFEPVSSTPARGNNTEGDVKEAAEISSGNSFSQPDAIGTPEPEDDNKSVEPKDNETSGHDSEYSFIVRMSDPSERREVIQKMMDEEAAKQMELTGPFRITYSVENGDISLVEVEDMGTGSVISNK